MRLLARFDSLLLAHAPRFRTRVLSEEHNPAVIKTVNGQVLATPSSSMGWWPGRGT